MLGFHMSDHLAKFYKYIVKQTERYKNKLFYLITSNRPNAFNRFIIVSA